jgi:hypothetical protein
VLGVAALVVERPRAPLLNLLRERAAALAHTSKPELRQVSPERL